MKVFNYDNQGYFIGISELNESDKCQITGDWLIPAQATDNPNLSPEMRAAADNLSKVKGMQEGFTPIQDAHVLNETSRLMSNQDRGWKTLTADAFKEAAAPDITKIQKLPGYLLNRITGGAAIVTGKPYELS